MGTDTVKIGFPILGAGNPLKKAALLADRLKREFGLEPLVGNSDAGDPDQKPAPYYVRLNGALVWSGSKLDEEAIVDAIRKARA